jgi:hypothetical protein
MILWPELVATLSATATVLWPVLEKLSSDAAEKFAGAFLEDALKSVFRAGEKPNTAFERELAKTLASGLAAFISLTEDELRDLGCDDAAIAVFREGFTDLLRTNIARKELGSAFTGQTPNSDAFAGVWEDLRPIPPALPTEFSWRRVLARYKRSVALLCGHGRRLPWVHRNADALSQGRLRREVTQGQNRCLTVNMGGWGTARWAGPVRVQRTEPLKATFPRLNAPFAIREYHAYAKGFRPLNAGTRLAVGARR